MAQFTVGCVPYVNAIPLVEMFEEMGPASPVRVIYRVPSELPSLLTSGEAQAILVSSVDALRVWDRRMAEGVCIGSKGPVKSVRLFSKKPFEQIQTLALDASSMTSNRLVMILLAEQFGIHPQTTPMAPNLETMMESADACVLIGDIGMMSDGSNLHVLDLGESWLKLTGKPFVWAAWIGDDKLTPDLVWWLQRAAACAGNQQDGEPYYIWKNRESMVARAMQQANWPKEVAKDYFENVMAYRMDASMLAGLQEFRNRLLENGFSDAKWFPELVAAGEPVTN
ncbi:MAG TPA: menaquinone biosynthesis protein [Fimbriimonadaceae bacterium]|nr:menaquinone biosynthesis protein [Fimbriimonadaceae bacterium]